jgi:hypothetical protein
MAIDYNWVCTNCGATNAAGTSDCVKCGSGAIISGFEIEARASGDLPKGVGTLNSPPISKFRKLLIVSCTVMFIVGVLLERPTVPPMLLWYIGIGLMTLGVVPLTLVALLRPRK